MYYTIRMTTPPRPSFPVLSSLSDHHHRPPRRPPHPPRRRSHLRNPHPRRRHQPSSWMPSSRVPFSRARRAFWAWVFRLRLRLCRRQSRPSVEYDSGELGEQEERMGYDDTYFGFLLGRCSLLWLWLFFIIIIIVLCRLKDEDT